MIRRGFWLVIGAVGGILGYRRASALTRQAAETLGARPKKPAAPRRRWARQAIRFTRDVREGMDLYMSRHEHRTGPTLSTESRRAPAPPPIEALGAQAQRSSALPVTGSSAQERTRGAQRHRPSLSRTDKKNEKDNH